MRVDVFFGAASLVPSDTQGRVVVVIDVLRASTTIATALANGAKNIIPFDSSEEAILRSKSYERGEVALAGERRMLRIPGFDLGNSPLEFTREAVEGKTVLLTTTNGTSALMAVQGARDVVVGAYVNFTGVLAMLRSAVRGQADVAILCAGSDRHFSLEDTVCAGHYVRAITRRLTRTELNDGAHACVMLAKRYGKDIPAVLRDAAHGRALAEAGFDGDLEACAQLDTYPIIPIYQDRQITKLGPDRER